MDEGEKGTRDTNTEEEEPKSTSVILYIKGTSVKTRRTLREYDIHTTFKTLWQLDKSKGSSLKRRQDQSYLQDQLWLWRPLYRRDWKNTGYKSQGALLSLQVCQIREISCCRAHVAGWAQDWLGRSGNHKCGLQPLREVGEGAHPPQCAWNEDEGKDISCIWKGPLKKLSHQDKQPCRQRKSASQTTHTNTAATLPTTYKPYHPPLGYGGVI